MTEQDPDYPRPERNAVRRSFDAAARRYDEAAVLQREVAERLLERLDFIKLAPGRILDAGCGTGYVTEVLRRRYPDARLIGLDLAEGMVRRARARLPLLARYFGGHRFVCGDLERLPLADGSVDLVVSNLTLQWCNLDRAFTELRRVLAPGGLLMFTSFGPDTLRELRASWAAVDEGVHVNHFDDLHDVGDALAQARFDDPVTDCEWLTLTYSEVRDLLLDLKAIGAHNVNADRKRALTPPKRLRAMMAAYEKFRRDGHLPATYEVVYGHAWAPEHVPQQHSEGGATHISLAQLRSGLKGN